jgi:hypothetical protein
LKYVTKALNARNALSPAETELLKEVKSEGILPGSNPLHEYMFWFAYHGIADLYSARLPDMLHTLYKGKQGTKVILFQYTLCLYLIQFMF